MQKLRAARLKREWSFTRAAQETQVSEQQLRNLEREGHTRKTEPGHIRAATMVSLLETFDELDLPDFADTYLRVDAHSRADS
jgi:hypothetical protein